LHFWNYQNINTSAAWLGLDKRPDNDVGRPTLFGHNMNGMHPFGVIYTCYRDVAGAAAGVEFALDEAQNLDATASIGDRQLFDQVVSYWEQRFRSRIQALRMYGVNGQLFNAAQQAFFVKNANNLDIEGLIPSAQYGEPENQRSEIDPFAGNIASAKALGLTGAGPDMTWAPFVNAEGQTVSLNLLDQWAFTPAIGDIGSVNEWMSTYQTKMNIAQTTCEIAGYEFYQDVDGDLVFKPPFYNLDTSTNRYYRLEDIDIINISFDEKEPTATFIKVKASWVKGLNGVLSNSDSTNKRALYIDYKLVAQFGWRGASWEISYVVDTRMLFFLGIARMDLLNIDVNSASCTIPIRPELRPGYPVYIPFCDCYYYISQISHTFSFGGQCTTSLVLTCRRTKFNAPGFLVPLPPGKSAIDLIRLDRPNLPPRPLGVIEGGVPRNVGFPNVVLALDPSDPNPNFSPVGVGLDYINSVKDVEVLFNIIRRDILLLDIFEVPIEGVGIEGNAQVTDAIKPDRFRLRWGPLPADYTEFGLEELKAAFFDLEPIRGGLRSLRGQDTSGVDGKEGRSDAANIQEVTRKLAEARQAETIYAQQRFTEGKDGPPNRSSERASLEAQLTNLQANELHAERALANQIGDVTPGGNGNLLAQIITALNSGRQSHSRRKIDGLPASDVTLAYFESLSHLKGQFTDGSIPGRYRYYSCSHPDPSQQGQPIMIFDDGDKQNPEFAPEQPSTSLPNFGRVNNAPGSTKFVPQEGGIFERLGAGLAQIEGLDDWLNTEKQRNILLGTTSERGETSEEIMNEMYAQNLLDITSVANSVVFAMQQDAEGYQVGVSASNGHIFASPIIHSGFRPNTEDSQSEAYHSQGIAIDIQFADVSFNRAKKDGYGEEYQGAIDAVRKILANFKNQGQFAYMRMYALTGRLFFHIDRRNSKAAKAIQARNQDRRDRYDAGTLKAPPVAAPLPDNPSRAQRERHRKAKKKRRAFFKTIAVEDPILHDTTQRPGARLPKLRGEGIEPKEWAEAKDGAAGWKKWRKQFGIPNQYRGLNPPQNKIDLSNPPPDNEPIPTDEQPLLVTNELPPEPVPIGKFETQEISLEEGRLVVQFSSQVKKESENEKAPDVVLTTGLCSKGLNVATGSGGLPRILTTDQIQTISFSFFGVNKFASVVGTSQTAGSLNFNGNSLAAGTTEVFTILATSLDDGTKTPNDVYKETWDSLRDQIKAIKVPIYQGQTLLGVSEQALSEALAQAQTDDATTMTVQAGALGSLGAAVVGGSSSYSIALESLDIGEFEDAVIIGLGNVPVGVAQLYPGQTAVAVAETDFNRLSKTPPFTSPPDANGQKIKPTAEAVAARYAGEITKKISAFSQRANAAAQIPPQLDTGVSLTIGRDLRTNSVKEQLNDIGDAAAGKVTVGDLTWVRGTVMETKTVNEGKTQKPKFAPIFPVSDEKGYRHYGAFRYGRGLTIEEGGTFEFLHSGDDPFRNVSAEAAEEFVQALTLISSGAIPVNQGNADNALRGVREAGAAVVLEQARAAADPTTEPVVDQPSLPPSLARERSENRQGTNTLGQVVSVLIRTGGGRDALAELLEMNGDDPNAIRSNNWDISDTQFKRRFANFSSNIAKTGVFKTTVANAAYRLADITSHLLERTGHSCVCRGSLADVVMTAYSQERFLAPEGINQEQDKATAAEAEKIIESERSLITQRDIYSGKVTTEIPDASTFRDPE
jgi:hypothetical protein